MMSNALRRLVGRHQDWLALATVLVLSSAAGLAVLALRMWYTGTGGYSFMVWNIFLAWIPLWLAVAVAFVCRGGRRPYALLAGLGLVWLLFFPNAPYLLTEFIHLDPQYQVAERPLARLAEWSPRREAPVWFDAALILMFAWTGLLLAFVSLHLVQRVVREALGAAWGWATVVVVLVLSAFGVSLGRFQRWNSWDLFSQPAELMADVAGRIFNPLAHPRTTAVTVIFSSFLLLAYLAVIAMSAVRMAAAAVPVRNQDDGR